MISVIKTFILNISEKLSSSLEMGLSYIKISSSSTIERQYLALCKDVLKNGEKRLNRTGIPSFSVFGKSLTFSFDEDGSFPLLTTKKVFHKGMIAELLWFLSGSTNSNDLPEFVRKWWSPWALPDGNLGPIYGEQLRRVKTYGIDGDDVGAYNTVYRRFEVDQIQDTIDNISKDPMSRRHIISTWGVGDIPNMQLAPCHGNIIQFYVTTGGKLNMQMYQRSADIFLGLPVNIASYALLLAMIAQVTGFKPGKMILVLGDAHIYENHVEQVKRQLKRAPMKLPQLILNPKIKDLDSFTKDDIIIKNYKSHGEIKGEVAV